MSKPFKILYKSFINSSNTLANGSLARNFSSLFFNEKCDLFVMQDVRMNPGLGNQDLNIGCVTRRYDNSYLELSDDPFALEGWFPPYFFDAVRTQTGLTSNYLVDKMSMSPSISLLIKNSFFIPVIVESIGTDPNYFTGTHILNLNNGQSDLIIASYCQKGTDGDQNKINLIEMIDKTIIYSNNRPFVLCLKVNMINTDVKECFNNSLGKNNCDIYNTDNPIIARIIQDNLGQYLNSDIYFISKGLDISFEFPPLPSFNIYPQRNELNPVILTLNNYKIDNPNTSNINNTISQWYIPGSDVFDQRLY